MIKQLLKKYIKNLPDPKIIRKSLHIIWMVDRIRFISSAIFILTGSTLLIFSTLFLRKTFNALSKYHNELGNHTHEIILYLIIAATTALLSKIIGFVNEYVSEIQGYHFNNYIEDKINDKSIELNMAFMESPAYYDILMQAKSAGANRVNGVYYSLVEFIITTLNILIIASFMFSVNWVLLILLMVMNIPTAFTKMYYSKQLFDLNHRQTALERKANYFSSLITDMAVIKEIKTYQTGHFFIDKYKIIRENLFQQRLIINRKKRAVSLIGTIFFVTGWFSAISYVIFSIIEGKTQLFDLTYLMTLIPQILSMTGALSGSLTGLYMNALYAKYVFELLEIEPDIKNIEHPVPIKTINTNFLEFKNVSFTYQNNERITLNKVNLQLETGKIVALVGLNGSGKTTLIKLLARLYDPSEGAILLGGVNIKDISISEYNKQLSIIFQDFARYHLSVSDNIRLGNIDADYDEEAIKLASFKSGAQSFIEELPEQYDTFMGRLFDKGSDLSIGQWQKVAIARALFKDSKFIVMDEPTSALDAASEKRFFEEFKDTIGDRGALLISHKISAVKYADYIYVLNAGEIIEKGTHQELIAKKGQYAWLFDADNYQLGVKNN
jgi:ATP-binding cassette subfamily B protein